MQKRNKPPSLFATFFARLRSQNPTKKPRPIKPGTSKVATPRPFQAISIYHGTVCCSVAKKISGYRFLARNAPQLPLSDCTMRKTCECRYMKHNDRRGETRRSMDFGMKPILFAAQERRKSQGRRSKD